MSIIQESKPSCGQDVNSSLDLVCGKKLEFLENLRI